MKNILVTGGCGFIGTNFIRYLLKESDFSGRVINVDKLTYAGNPENLFDIKRDFPERYIFVKVDICDRQGITRIFDDYGIDTVCHFAAESHVDRSIVSPDSFIQTNIVGTFNLLESAKSKKDRLQLFYHVSTDEVFGSLGKKGLFTEETPYRPNSPYSASKAASDHLVRAYYKTYGLPIIISNCSNNYGPYQFPEKLIPLIILNALEGKPLPIYGDGRYVRDWLYVRDHCIAIWELIKNGERGNMYNIGGNNEVENIHLVEMICDILDGLKKLKNNKSRRELITFVKDRPGHDRRYAIDSTKLKRELGWIPEESLEKGIHKTIKWYLNNQEWVSRVRSGEYQSWIRGHYDYV
ncbi:MAG: dTDP-glucose 4,6-dehydratase [Deltaproteobacteria bacterium]|nr:dTDP-glucose 4,6-dehydratase [Deltaproteobacteria bacterium]MBW1933240.1 dTDP-glucose 4,6-dehydratase [Deltaproteobacteria bacterium]MBW1939116.1 dTDP-glucose 4,6-dehydratase [Deltaproteobacteria bacterium]MBW1965396.1 dTDP-glucose 4,6-dehydratase [Deltaproteobacteria bacterium]